MFSKYRCIYTEIYSFRFSGRDLRNPEYTIVEPESEYTLQTPVKSHITHTPPHPPTHNTDSKTRSGTCLVYVVCIVNEPRPQSVVCA